MIRNIKTQLVIGFGALIWLLLLAGCGPREQDVLVSPSVAGESRNQISNTTELQTVEDSTKTKVQIVKHPQRIISIGSSTDDLVIPLVGTDRIIAITKSPANNETAVAQIKNKITTNVESIYAFRPDLVIVPNWLNEGMVEQLRELNIPVYVYKTPKTMVEMQHLILELSQITGEISKGQDLLRETTKEINQLRAKAIKIPDNQRKVAIYYGAMGITGGKNTTFDDLAYTAGLINGAALLGLKNAEVASREAMIQVNPDIIFLPSHIFDQDTFTSPEAEQLYEDPALQNIKAVKNKQIYTIDARWLMSYSQFMIQGAQAMYAKAYE